jgi:hypothetical protein
MWFLAGEMSKISMHHKTNFQGCISINTWHGESISTAASTNEQGCHRRYSDDAMGWKLDKSLFGLRPRLII